MTDAIDLFAQQMGTTRSYALSVLKDKHPSTLARLQMMDAATEAAMEAAVVEELASLAPEDIEDLAQSDDPSAELSNLVSTRAERSLRASLAAHESWARTEDPAARTEAARDAFAKSFEAKVDPEGTMDPAERKRRAEHLRKAHYKRMALKSAQARRARRS